MDQAVLRAQARPSGVSAQKLRRQGFLPIEFYGHGVANQTLMTSAQDFRRLFRLAGESTVLDLKVEGGKDSKALVHNVDYHPVTSDILHVELINVNMNEEITTHIPVILEGQAPAVKEQGGILIQNLDEVEIRCLPGDLVHELKVSVEGLVDFHSVLHVSDIPVPAKIQILTDPEVAIATVSAPRSAEEETSTEVDVASVEAINEKKGEEGAGA